MLPEAIGDLEQFLGLGVALGSRCVQEAFGRLRRVLSEFLEADCSIDAIAQHSLASVQVGCEQAFNTFTEQGLAKALSRWTHALTVPLKSRVSAGLLLLAVYDA